ncbi:PaaI family thioesterase [Solihabitans fulvus]|uniref:PaaI family thioesterase n=1 Tax=Solihabitans fulvus TaxID=1892852 RepID=A0A5B2WQ12_9PSEU|nr:PaaI family thioesterase [Solihabitans fulvus]KAA2252822.1 PaaI family thioesterase [Solihabitans fulvus]
MTADWPEGEPVQVPWRVLADYRCFGCSPHNDTGLRLTFRRTGDGISCRLTFDRAFESYPGVVHGGIVSTVCDEIMGNLLVLRTGLSVCTTTLRTRYVAPVLVGREYLCVARTQVRAADPSPYRAQAEVLLRNGTTAVTAVGQYLPMTTQQARSRMDLTDTESALVERELARISNHRKGEPGA